MAVRFFKNSARKAAGSKICPDFSDSVSLEHKTNYYQELMEKILELKNHFSRSLIEDKIFDLVRDLCSRQQYGRNFQILSKNYQAFSPFDCKKSDLRCASNKLSIK